MKLASLTLIITDDCNFNCSYCYKTKTSTYMDDSTVEKALLFFCPT
jgi:molybdenum cofactor biosynthesis enzyme MoaA